MRTRFFLAIIIAGGVKTTLIIEASGINVFNGDLTGIIGIIIFAILFAWYFLSMKKSNAQDSAK